MVDRMSIRWPGLMVAALVAAGGCFVNEKGTTGPIQEEAGDGSTQGTTEAGADRFVARDGGPGSGADLGSTTEAGGGLPDAPADGPPPCLPSSCTPPPNADPTCVANACDFVCKSGFHREGGACPANTTAQCCGMACTACPPVANGTAACMSGACSAVCTSGFHLENGKCEPNANVDCCGPSCTKCSAPANADPVCTSQQTCTFACKTGYHRSAAGTACAPNTTTACCGDSCTTCPAITNGTTKCSNGSCDWDCNTNYHKTATGCALNNTAACCGPECKTCPAVTNGRPRCNQGGNCAVECNTGYHASGYACLANDIPSCCGTTCQNCPRPANSSRACVNGSCEFTCDSNYHEVGNTCQPNSGVGCCGPSCAMCTASRPNSTATCEMATGCVTPSPCTTATHHECGSDCVENNDVDHCGSSCSPCPVLPNSTPGCNGTACTTTCDMHFADCTNDPGCETDTRTSALHCGGCNKDCKAHQECNGGTCACAAGWADCDGDASNGCEGDLNGSVHCGGCNTDPTPMDNPKCTGLQTCVGMVCVP
jgi:hypothetical protein